MPTSHPEIFAALAAEFTRKGEVRTRKGGGNTSLRYITARTVMIRLDEVLGPENWQFSLQPWGDDALIGTLTIRLPDRASVAKSDVGGTAGMSDAQDDTKSAASDCLKRCAVLFGIGRYLYQDGVANLGPPRPADSRTRAERLADWAHKEGHWERLKALARSSYDKEPAKLTDGEAVTLWKLIKDSGSVANVPAPPPVHQPGKNGNGNPVKFGWPHSGVALYAWCKRIEESFKTSVVKSVQEAFCRGDGGWDSNFRGWNPDQVNQAATYVATLASKFPGYSGEWDDKLPRGLADLRDAIWTAASALTEALGVPPTTDAVEAEIQKTCQMLAKDFGGEVISELETCENEPLMKAVLNVLESDLADTRKAY